MTTDDVEQVKRQILDDMRLGLIPESVQSFGDLHLYVDANDYLQPFVDWDHPGSEGEFARANEVSDAIDAWLRVRRHA